MPPGEQRLRIGQLRYDLRHHNTDPPGTASKPFCERLLYRNNWFRRYRPPQTQIYPI